MIALANILVAVDFDGAATNAMTYARELARRFDATLHVLHVVDDTPARMMAATTLPFGVDPSAAALAYAREHLNAFVTADDRRELRVVTVPVVGSSPSREILNYAEGAHIDLIIVGTVGRGPLSHLFMGCVAEHVVRAASCPVLTVHEREREFVRPDALQELAHA
jgi:nucleotide-binding universal stress UspA family protein